MAKLTPRKSGKKNKDNIPYITGYDAFITKSKLIEAGFIDTEGNVAEYEATVVNNTIVLTIKEPDGE